MHYTAKKFILGAAVAATIALPLTAHAADATSFNPTTVKVTAKPISSIPVGTIISWPVAQNPADWQNPDGSYNWLECNGQAISQTAYPELFALMGGKVPDLRGLFLRGYGSQSYAQNNGSTIGVTSTTHTSGALGQVQGDAIRNIRGDIYGGVVEERNSSSGVFQMTHGGPGGDGRATDHGLVFDTSRVVPTAQENRPANTAVRYLVRSRP